MRNKAPECPVVVFDLKCPYVTVCIDLFDVQRNVEVNDLGEVQLIDQNGCFFCIEPTVVSGGALLKVLGVAGPGFPYTFRSVPAPQLDSATVSMIEDALRRTHSGSS